MDKPTSSVDRTSDHVSRQDLDHLQHVIEVLSTQTRIKWELPPSAEAELQACGRVGLSEAIARYDSSRGASLRTYAELRVSGAIKNGAKALYLTRRRGALCLQGYDRRETDSGDKWDRWFDFFEEVALSSSVASAYESTAVRNLHETPEDRMIREEGYGQLYEALAALDPRSQHALKRIFFDEAEQRLVADELNIDKANVTRLKQRALGELLALLQPRDGDGA